MSGRDWAPPTGLEPRGAEWAIWVLLALTASAQLVTLYGDLDTGLYLMVALAFLTGIAAGLRVDGMASIVLAARHEPQPSLRPTVTPLFLLPAISIVVGLVLPLPLIAMGDEGADVLFLPLGFALVTIFGSLLGSSSHCRRCSCS